MRHAPLRRLTFAALLAVATASPGEAATDLKVLGGRFQVTADWRTATGTTGHGQAVPYSAETGFFWFFSATNVELVVKVIDACAPPFGRFWFFASGLTDTEVTLTVTDTWSGERETYHHPGGALFTPIADTGRFATCGAAAPACGQGSLADLQASPRADRQVEELALILGSGVAAEGVLYDRLSADLGAIRASDPALVEAYFLNIWWAPQSLIVGFTAEAHAAAKQGTYHEWDCLNERYGGRVDHVYQYTPDAVLAFAPLLHPFRVGADYLALPGITAVYADSYSWPTSGPPPTPGLCARTDGTAIDWFIETNPIRYLRVADAGAPPVAMGSWNGLEPRPSWWQQMDDCYTNLQQRATPLP